jgi:hypothetical protein
MDDERFLDGGSRSSLACSIRRPEQPRRTLSACKDFSEISASARRWDQVSTIAWRAAEPG